jgi:predicted CXXCH cytochrome family protein
MVKALLRVFAHFSPSNRTRVAILAVAAVFAGVAFAQEAKEHPRLVSADAARCELCHDDVLDKPVKHAAAEDDCTTCHEITVSESGTLVALMDAEPSLCVLCHDDLEAAAGGDLENPHYPVTESCLTCHDPHSTDGPRLLVAAARELCSTCHDDTEMGEAHGGQLTEATDCTLCHQPHGSDHARMMPGGHPHAPFADGSCEACHRPPFGTRIRLRARGEKLCEACHGDIAESDRATGSVHGALRGQRKAGCLSCHEPHVSSRAALLVESGPELCRSCHAEVVEAAMADTGHYPAADDCTTCHHPHSSPEPTLLDAPSSDLCRACHDPDDTDLTGAHLGADLGSLQCVECHTPHGTGHEKLLATNVHAPILEGCDTCHEGAWNQVMEDGESSLCVMCHDDIEELSTAATVPHAAMEMARCADCHNPHASRQERLVKHPEGAVCTQCHDDQSPADGETAHGVIALIGCQACHEPHGGNQETLLRSSGNDLCLACHASDALRADKQGLVRMMNRFEVPAEETAGVGVLELSADNTSGHPVALHRVLGFSTKAELKRADATFEEELTCLACHDPHKGRSALLRWNAASPMEACLQCHPK